MSRTRQILPSRLLFALLLAANLTAPAIGDLLLKGSKWAHHRIVLEDLDKQRDHVFYAYPRDLLRSDDVDNTLVRFGPDGAVNVNAFNPLSVAENDGVNVIAVPRALFDKTRGKAARSWIDGSDPTVLRSKRKLAERPRAVAADGAVTGYTTRYRVDMKNGLDLTLVSESEDRADRPSTKADSKGPGRDPAQPLPAGTLTVGAISIALAAAALIAWTLLARGSRLPNSSSRPDADPK